MSEEVDKHFVINTLTNDALQKLTVPVALQLINGSVRDQITKEVEDLNETELSTLHDSVKKAVEEAQEKQQSQQETEEVKD